MLIRNDAWERIRTQFTEDEKQALRKADAGSIVCPPAVVLDEHLLPAELVRKVNAALQGVRK